jgi:phage-related protein
MNEIVILNVIFFASENGNEPVRDWLKSLSAEDRKVIGVDIKTIQFRWPLGMPLVRKMDAGLWEVRSRISDGRISRVFFSVSGSRMILLHGIIKKSIATPKRDLACAKKRRDAWRGNKEVKK